MSENYLTDLRFDSLQLHKSLQASIHDAGFEFCEYHNLTGGIVALHKAIKV